MESEEIFVPEEKRVELALENFANIAPLHAPAQGLTRLFTATRYGRRYILKALAPSALGSFNYRNALRKEFEIGLALDHPNIRRTLGLENVEGIGEAIVLEYVDGMPLSEALQRGMVTQANARYIVRQIAAALEYLHAHQVVHSDLKPANILLTVMGDVVKLIDFSFADSGTFTVAKLTGGTRSYMAPEQETGTGAHDVRWDIYSLGKIAVEIGEAAGDPDLIRMGEECAMKDPGRRPSSIVATRLLSLPLQPRRKWLDLRSPKLTSLLLMILLILLILIIWLLY